jgi:exonuclease III
MQHAPAGWVIDPEDPRAPPQELWDRMTPAERQRVVDALPSEFEVSQTSPPEGDFHFEAKGEKLRFYHGLAALLETDELITRLGSRVGDLERRVDDAERRAEEAERALAEALAEIERLKRERS